MPRSMKSRPGALPPKNIIQFNYYMITYDTRLIKVILAINLCLRHHKNVVDDATGQRWYPPIVFKSEMKSTTLLSVDNILTSYPENSASRGPKIKSKIRTQKAAIARLGCATQLVMSCGKKSHRVSSSRLGKPGSRATSPSRSAAMLASMGH